MNREEAHKLVDQIFDASGADIGEVTFTPAEEKVERVLPEGQRAVRTKSSGDRVYLLDEVKKTRQWVTNPDVLAGLGFESQDVQEVDDSILLKYNMGPAIYKVD